MAKRFLTLDEVAANAMTITSGATAEDRLIFLQWVWIGLRDLGPTVDNLNVVELTPTALSFTKPADFVMAADIALFDENGAEIYYKFRRGKERIHQDIINDLQNNVELSEDQYYFHMSSNATNVASAKLRYFTMPLDEDGQPLIPEVALLALMFFCRYMWEIRKGDNRFLSREYERGWQQERAKARARLRPTSMLTAKQIAKEWVSMIPKPRYDFF